MNRFLRFLLKYKLHHVLFWLLYYYGWVQVYTGFYEHLSDLLLITLVYAVAHASMFYVTQYLFIPRLLRKRKTIAFVLAFVGLLAIITLFMYMGIELVLGSIAAFGVPIMQFMIYLATSCIFMTAVLISIKGFMDYLRNLRTQERIDRERLETELQYLKAQVNPHFLFNTINSVYVLIKQDPEKASDTLIRLSDLLRSQLYDFGGDKISIEQEIDYLENYIELERIRKGDKLLFEMEIGEEVKGFRIAPLMLIPFLENCFKHVSAQPGQSRQIQVKLERNETRFLAHFFNTKDPGTEKIEQMQGGIGLNNIRRRLELLYAGGYILAIDNQPASFDVKLSLNIDERKN